MGPNAARNRAEKNERPIKHNQSLETKEHGSRMGLISGPVVRVFNPC